MDTMEKLLLKPAEVGDMTGLGKSKTYALIAAGVIPSVRIGKSVRVPADRLRRWIEELHVHELTPPVSEPSPSVDSQQVPGRSVTPILPCAEGAHTVKKRSQRAQKGGEL